LWPRLWLGLCRPLLTHLLWRCARRLLLRSWLLLTHLLWRCARLLLLRTRLLLAHLLWRFPRRLLLWSWLLLAHHRLLLWRGTHGRRPSHLHLALLTL
jgi:hypothetical protein